MHRKWLARASSFTLAGALIAALGTAPCAAGQGPGRVEVLLEAATRKEIVDGDLKAALSMYGNVAAQAGDNRLVAATALVRMGRCHEQLGRRAEARKIYRRVVKEFADQKPQAAEARRRGAVLGGGSRPKAETAGRKPGSPS